MEQITKLQNTYEHTILCFVAFRLQFNHIFDENFRMSTEHRLDAVCKQKKKRNN